MSRTALWAFIFGSSVIACAIDVPPPGGPVDETPPTVAATIPAADSAGVDPGSEIGITFSEDMTRARVERLVKFDPPIEIGRIRWKDRTIIIRPLQPLHPDTTYLVTVGSGYRDNHNVASTEEFSFAFATAAAIDSGSISGRVYFRRKPTSKAVVRCFLLPVDSGFTPAAERPNRETSTDDQGDYVLSYLPTRANEFIVWAFEDANQNGMFAPEKEAGMVLADTVKLTPNAPFAIDRDIYIVDPTEPAVVTGVVESRSPLDTFGVFVTLHPDSLKAKWAYLTTCDSTGAYRFSKVLGGTYFLRAFVDVMRDTTCGWYPCFDDTSASCAEPCALYPDTLFIEPGAEAKLDSLVIEPTSEREG